MSRFVGWMDRVFYPHHADNWDDALFRGQILQEIDEAACVLDLGAGAGVVSQMNFRGRAAKVCGVDPDDRGIRR